MDKALSGKSGKTTYEQALDGRIIPTGHQQTTPAVPGRDVRLTINSDLQWFAQNALAQKVIQTQALSGTVVVQNARTGELLAVASYPTFDPNSPGQSQENWTNKAFSEVYEPGSTAKVMTAAAALEEGVVTPSTVVEVPNRIWRADSREFKDSHDHPTEYLTFAGVLAQSSNIGTILAGEQLKPTTLHDYFYRFGLGQSSGMGFPGEGTGLFKPAKDWDGSQRYTVVYGQGLSVNALQATEVFQTIANNGVRVPPRLIALSRRRQGRVRRDPGAQAGAGGLARHRQAAAGTCSRASSARRAPPRRPGSRATGWPARPAPPTATTPRWAGTPARRPASSGSPPRTTPRWSCR